LIRKELKPAQTWIYHGIAKASLIQEILTEGLIVSVGAGLLSNKNLQEAVKLIPFEQMLLETDDSLVPIEHIYHNIAELKGMPISELKEEIARTFKRTFKKWNNG
jgi:TatD DNase family protein